MRIGQEAHVEHEIGVEQNAQLEAELLEQKRQPRRVDAQEILDPAAQRRKGAYEYGLGGKSDPKLLTSRVFGEKTRTLRYQQQHSSATVSGSSNCPLCALGDNANKSRIYTMGEMDADHVSAWSTGGQTDLWNCEMLCVTHNRAKGNR